MRCGQEAKVNYYNIFLYISRKIIHLLNKITIMLFLELGFVYPKFYIV